MPVSIPVNTLRPRQNGRHFADDTFKCIFLNENVWIPIKISLKFVPQGPINNIPALVQIMAWRRPGDKPLSEPMMVRLPTHICVTRPQWVKTSCDLVKTIYVIRNLNCNVAVKKNSEHKPLNFETLWNLTIRRLIGLWNIHQDLFIIKHTISSCDRISSIKASPTTTNVTAGLTRPMGTASVITKAKPHAIPRTNVCTTWTETLTLWDFHCAIF